MADSRYPASPVDQIIALNIEFWPLPFPPSAPKDPRSNSEFWLFHPIKRGLVTGALCGVFSPTTRFTAGFLYGALSSVFNLGLRSTTNGLREKMSSPESLALTYIIAAMVPWAASALTMRHAHKLSSKPLFHVAQTAAIVSAAVVEFVDPTNKDMLYSKTPKI